MKKYLIFSLIYFATLLIAIASAPRLFEVALTKETVTSEWLLYLVGLIVMVGVTVAFAVPRLAFCIEQLGVFTVEYFSARPLIQAHRVLLMSSIILWLLFILRIFLPIMNIPDSMFFVGEFMWYQSSAVVFLISFAVGVQIWYLVYFKKELRETLGSEAKMFTNLKVKKEGVK